MDANSEIEVLRFNVVRSIRYHDKRRGFFDRVSKFSKIISFFGSTAAAVTILKSWSDLAAAIFAASAAGFTIVDTICGTAARYTLHTDLKNRFAKLLNDVEIVQKPTEQEIIRLRNMRREIEESEPPVLHVLNSICFNDSVSALGLSESEMVTIGSMQGFFAQWFDLCPSTIKKVPK